MTKGITPRFIPRKDSTRNFIKIVLFLYDNQFSSLKQICRYDGNKNYKTTTNYVLNMVENKIICKVPYWHGTAYYVNVDGDKVIHTIASYHTTKYHISLRINKITKHHPQLKEKFTKRGVGDFNKITKTNIPTKPFDVSGLDDGCTTVVNYINLIILATRVLILEEKRSKKTKSDSIQLVKRQARICEMWLDLESFLDEEFGKSTTVAELMTMVKSRKIKYELKLYKDYFSHITHSDTSFSEYVKILRQIQTGYKQEYAQSSGLSMSAVSKILRKFTDKSGRINMRYLIDMRRIENASLPSFHDKDIEDLWYFKLFSDELNRTRLVYDEKSKVENKKIRKIVKQICPDMQIVN